jgi:germination protein M
MRMKCGHWFRVLGVLILMLSLATGGCTFFAPPAEDDNENGNNAIDPAPPEDTVTVVLYFGGPNAERLVREERTVVRQSERTEAVVIRELLKGPETAGLLATIPAETQLLDIRVTEGTAFVSFSRDIQTRHGGGTAGEMMTIYSIVNSLTELAGIVQVQILIEGDKAETLAGHLEIMEPLERNPFILQP